MGLDMYLHGDKYRRNAKPDEDGFVSTTHIVDLGYWRKHPNLHGFIVETFADGEDECQKIELSEADIYTIIGAIKSKSLPDTTGFFFGQSTGDDEEIAQDVSIFERALGWLKAAPETEWRSIYYQASW